MSATSFLRWLSAIPFWINVVYVDATSGKLTPMRGKAFGAIGEAVGVGTGVPRAHPASTTSRRRAIPNPERRACMPGGYTPRHASVQTGRLARSLPHFGGRDRRR